MRLRSAAAVLTFLLASVVNPAVVTGCGRPISPSFDFGEPEMVALVGEANRAAPYRLPSLDGDLSISFELAQVAGMDRTTYSQREDVLVRTARACSNRSFLRSASACLDTTTVPLEGTLTVADAAGAKLIDRAAAKGRLIIVGTTLRGAHGQLDLGAADDGVFLTTQDGRNFVVAGAKIGNRVFTPGRPATTFTAGRR